MSICNVAITPGKILVAVDTAIAGCRLDDIRTTAHVPKAMIVGDTLIASRGNIGMLRYATMEALGFDAYLDVDTVAAALPMLLQRALAHCRRARAELGGEIAPADEGCEMTVAGWSRRTGQARAVIATMTADGRCEVEEIHTTCAGPAYPGAQTDNLSTPLAMLEAARKQVQAFATLDPDSPIGGELVVYELMQGGIVVRKMGQITEQQETPK